MDGRPKGAEFIFPCHHWLFEQYNVILYLCLIYLRFSITNQTLKQHYVTWTGSFKKQNFTSHQTAIFVKLGHILWRESRLFFPLMLCDCSVCLQPFIYGAVTNNNPLLQLRSAGSLHAAFRNLRESQS